MFYCSFKFGLSSPNTLLPKSNSDTSSSVLSLDI
jgi:hypothetical protein